jgi:hypothetical protein
MHSLSTKNSIWADQFLWKSHPTVIFICTNAC